jgi:hypothetical protein
MCFIGIVILAFAISGRISLIVNAAVTTNELLPISPSLSLSLFATIGAKANLVFFFSSSFLLHPR